MTETLLKIVKMIRTKKPVSKISITLRKPLKKSKMWKRVAKRTKMGESSI